MTDAGFPYLSLLTGLPLLGALIVAVLPRSFPGLARQIALVWSLGVLALTVVMWFAFKPNGSRFQLREAQSG